MEGRERLERAWQRAQDGEDVAGTIDCGDAYIKYTTHDINGTQYFKLHVGREDEYVAASPSQPVRNAIATAISAVPKAAFIHEDGEMCASVRITY